MKYSEIINSKLQFPPKFEFTALDLFAGCGGLALGFEANGIETIGYEMLSDACETYNHNLKGNCTEVKLSSETKFPHADIIIGGPPCQPFSVGGLQKGLKDSRDGFPIFISAVNQVQPELCLFENVRGLKYKNKWYFDEIISTLRSLGYLVEEKLLNANNYNVPQNRERIIVIGHKGDFNYPEKTKHVIPVREAFQQKPPKRSTDIDRFFSVSMDKYVAKYEKASKCKVPRDLHMDRPARTLTCRNLAGATGDMHRIRLSDGKRKRLLTSEAARLQSFPDWFTFKGKESSVFNQIGNAVPPMMSYALARAVLEYLKSDIRYTSKEISQRHAYVSQELFI